MAVFLGKAVLNETSVASAATVDLGATNTVRVAITGTATITSFGTRAKAWRKGRFTGTLRLTHNATSLILPNETDIITEPGDTFEAFSDASGNWRIIDYRSQDAIALEAAFQTGNISRWAAVGGTTGSTLSGAGTAVAAGTATARTPATTSLFTSVRRLGYVSATSAGSSAGITPHNNQVFHRGNAAGQGGFRARFRFGSSDPATVANARCFAGLTNLATTIGNVEPSSLVNCIGVAADAGDANLSIMHNDASGAATEIALGANFPALTLSVDWYDLLLIGPPNAAYVDYILHRMNTGDLAQGRITTDLPALTNFICPQVWRNNGATALACAVDVGFIQIITKT